MTEGAALVRLDRVSRSFDGGRIVALREASLAVSSNETVAVVGPSGSGKSSLLSLMCGIDRPDDGGVFWRGEPVDDVRRWATLRASEIGIVFQDFLLLHALTALQNVRVAVRPGTPIGQGQAMALDLLARVGLSNRAGHRPSKLSGGERQRVAIARSLVNTPSLLLADEPTGALDSENAERVMRLMLDLQKERGHALVVVTHDAKIAERCGRRIFVTDGAIESGKR